MKFFDWVIKFNNSQPYIDLIIVFLIILGGFAAKRYFKPNFKKLPTTISTLVVGTFFVIVYLILQAINGIDVKTDAIKYFISYATATTLYDFILKWFMIGIRFIPSFLQGILSKVKTPDKKP